MKHYLTLFGCALVLGLAPVLADQVVTDQVDDEVIIGPQSHEFVNVVKDMTLRALFYSNSRNLADPYKITRAGGHCATNGSATDLQTLLGLTTYGWGCQVASNNAMADDFVLCDQATIQQIAFYLYQTGVTSPSINRIDYAILTADPEGQPPPAWTTVNNPPVAFTNVYKKRDIDGATANCTRQIQKVTITLSPPVTLGPGRYWLAWMAGGTGTSGPWQPPVVFLGLTNKPGANGLQSTAGGVFVPALDGGIATPQDFIFELYGTAPAWPTGACCLLTGECVPDTTECECMLSLDGTWQGPQTGCDPNPCEVFIGACCFLDGSCELQFPADCMAVYGDYMGPETSCDPNPCPPPCIQCPPEAVLEGEPPCYNGYVDNFNGGCNSTPNVFSPITCSQTVCGTAGNFLSGTGGQTRDTDWYEYVSTEPLIFTWTATGTFPIMIFVIQAGPEPTPCTGYTVLNPAGTTAPACQPASFTTACMPPGKYWFWVGTQGFAGVPCNSPYVATLTCAACPPPFGACCFGPACEVLTQTQCLSQGGVYQGDGTDCFPNPCVTINYYWDFITGEQGGDGYNGEWIYYPNAPSGPWWNMWWPNEFALDRQKQITVTFTTGFPGGGVLEAALNWATPNWPLLDRPPLAEEEQYIERQFLDVITMPGTYTYTVLLPFCPSWVSMDIRGSGFTIEGLIDHVCLPPQTGACCFTGSVCVVLTAQDCAAAGGTFKGLGTTCDPNPCICIGDLNCDGVVDFGDINPFVLYLSNFNMWQATYPGCPARNGDINGDGQYPSFGDINPFVALIVQSPIVCQY